MTDGNDVRVIQTRQGDTIDKVCQRYFNQTRDVTEKVLAMNPDVTATVVFESGVPLKIPINNIITTSLVVSLWD